MTIDFSRDKPIYTQLVERICGEIIREALKPGDRLLSVREYAVDVGVNVNTVQRVYKELELMNLTETKRGQGTFITESKERLLNLREEMKQNLVDSFLYNMESFGFTREEMVEVLLAKGRGE